MAGRMECQDGNRAQLLAMLAAFPAEVVSEWAVALSAARLAMGPEVPEVACSVPVECSSEIARGGRDGQRLAAFRPKVMVPVGDGDWRAEEIGYRGRVAARQVDAFDAMDAAAARAGVAALTMAQVTAGRRYRHLTEVVAAGAVKLSRLSAGSGGPEARDWMDGYIARCGELRRMHAAIGGSVPMAVRRVRPSVRGTRQRITMRALVDGVCLGDMALDAVLEAHGWSRNGKTRAAVRRALVEALDRMSEVAAAW